LAPNRLGDFCVPLGVAPGDSCAEGLLCIIDRCGRPCSAGVSDSCPAGYSCAKWGGEFGCYPICKPELCPAGQTCVAMDALSYCAEQIGDNCSQHSCPEGLACLAVRAQHRASFSCRMICNPLKANSCQTGFVCGFGANPGLCYRACEPGDNPSRCSPDEECTFVDEEQTLHGCLPG